MMLEGGRFANREKKENPSERETPYVVLSSNEIELDPRSESGGLKEMFTRAHNEGGYIEYSSNPGFAISHPSDGPKLSDNFTSCQGQLITIKTVSGKRLSILSHQESRTASIDSKYQDGEWIEKKSQFVNVMKERILEMVSMDQLKDDPLDLATVRLLSFGGRAYRAKDGSLDLVEGERKDLLKATQATLQEELDNYATRSGLNRAIVPDPIQLHLPREEGHDAGGGYSSYLYNAEKDTFYVIHANQNARQTNPYAAYEKPSLP